MFFFVIDFQEWCGLDMFHFKLLFSVKCMVSDSYSGACLSWVTPLGRGHSYRNFGGRERTSFINLKCGILFLIMQ